MTKTLLTILLGVAVGASQVRIPGPGGSPQANITISLVAHGGCGSSVSASCTTSALNDSGATLAVAVVTDNNSTLPTVSDSGSNSWTLATSQTTTGYSIAIYYSSAPAVTTSDTFTAHGSHPGIVVSSWSGRSTWSTDQINGAVTALMGSAALAPASSITPTASPALVIFGATLTNGTWSSFGGTCSGCISLNSITNSTGPGGVAAYANQASATAIQPTVNTTASGAAGGIAIVSFK